MSDVADSGFSLADIEAIQRESKDALDEIARKTKGRRGISRQWVVKCRTCTVRAYLDMDTIKTEREARAIWKRLRWAFTSAGPQCLTCQTLAEKKGKP